MNSKIGAIARYEVIMAWRRGSLPILGAVLLIMITGFGLSIAQGKEQSGLYVDPVVRAAAARGLEIEVIQITLRLMSMLVLMLLAFGIALMLFLTETIPLDRQFKMRELLDTLPISRTVYLGGKLLGVWIGLTLMLVVVAATSLGALRLIVGMYDVRVIGLMWLVVVLPFCAMGSAVSVLTSAFARSRRSAMMLGIALLPVSLVVWGTTVISLARVGGLVDAVYLEAVTLTTPLGETPAQIGAYVGSALLLMVGITLAVWTFAWVGERWQEGR